MARGVTMARGPDLSEGDAQVLNALREAGSNLALPHPIDHSLYFPDGPTARSAAKALEGAGYRVDVRPGDGTANTLVLASHAMVPTPQAVAETTLRMERFAISLGGEYDGWEAQIVK